MRLSNKINTTGVHKNDDFANMDGMSEVSGEMPLELINAVYMATMAYGVQLITKQMIINRFRTVIFR